MPRQLTLEQKRARITPRGSSLLRHDTEVKGQYEPVIKAILLEAGIRAHYEPFMLRLPSGMRWLPDFLLDMEFRGRKILLEPHGQFSGHRRNTKLSEALRVYGDLLYIVDIRINRKVSTSYRITNLANKVADERWILPKIDANPELDDVNRLIWMDLARKELNQLIERANVANTGSGLRGALRKSA
ncbi:MAG: hypothetical protein KGH64_04595 [Candidatus Micrarchaeota archaeon]|nr:hypothetical protein [Candidatus Micrarchaeota archaeon]MDE1834591.1 hypothetical protein [Candidatus Micrarchaeota archaeon]MDE1859620.1 hypothetical protein [Candidatus Micrarchaeota archaeon]